MGFLIDPSLLVTLSKWGVKTCGDLAAIPEKSLTERWGEPGVYLRRLACGSVNRPLKVAPSSTSYQERVELEHPLSSIGAPAFSIRKSFD